MGYFDDQEGIMRRYIREADQWKQHLENTKAAILMAASSKKKRKLAILGSGWLLDVPIDELSAMFEQVWLFDIKHPAQVTRKIKQYANVQMTETDISGFAVDIFNMVAKESKPQFFMDTVKPMFDFDLNDFDFVVSCNVLNQLDILLLDYIKSSIKISLNMETQLRKLIQQTHINLLPKSRSCLVSDIEELAVDKDNKIIQRKALVHIELSDKNIEKEWIWHFDNHFTYKANSNTWFKVVTLNF